MASPDSSRSELPPEWRELLSLLPGYDSEATAAPGDYFDPDVAQLAIDFFPSLLQLIEGEHAGKPFHLQRWQQAVVAALFGWRRADSTRRYRECLLYVPRKNGKTPFAAGLMLLVAFTDGEPGAQHYSAGSDREQAALIYRHAAGMIEREPELAKRSRVYRSFRSIEFPDSGIYKALSSDAGTKHGLGAHLVIVDELHAHKDSELVDVLLTSTAARRQPLVIYLTTSDIERPSVCNQKYDYACGVRDGRIPDHAFLPVIYEAPKDADWTSEETWRVANPSLGVSVSLDYLRRECERAKQEPSYENTFRRLHLNQRTGQTTRWLRVEDWGQCAREFPDLTGRECYGGLDLSTTTDVSAFVLAFPPHIGPDGHEEPVYLLPFFWIPERKAKESRDRVPYELWAKQGHLRITPGDVVDYDTIRADINELAARFDVQAIRYDPWNATQLAGQLAEQDGLNLVQHRQGYVSMSAPSKEFERLIISQGLAHDGNPVLTWMIGNAAIRTDPAGNIKPDKGAKQTGRIDGVVAGIMALAGTLSAQGASVYAQRGLIAL